MMTTNLRVLAVVALALGASAGRADADPDAEVAKLRERVKALETENAVLKAEVARFKHMAQVTAAEADPVHQAGLRRLLELERALGEKPDAAAVRKEAADLAAKLAPELPGNPLVWGMLLKTGVLKDGMTLKDAEKLLGPPTDKSGTVIGWYFNPNHRHVAPYLHAQPTEDGLVGWKLNSR
jgi:hypothetical protein